MSGLVRADTVSRDLDPATCLAATRFIDSSHPAILAAVDAIATGPDDITLAAELFGFVQNDIRYEFRAKMVPEQYVASYVLEHGQGFCVQKAVLLCALGRAAGIPTALVMSDLTDHTLPPPITQVMGGNTMFQHGLNAIFLNGRWLLADASLSPDIVRRKRYRPIVFDGTRDALHSSTRLDGAPHADYQNFHGLFADLQFEQMMNAFALSYPGVDPLALTKLGY
ncbi:MAG: hypothetical protein QG571_22 [Pseudomonadota bacterium]|nr:hypothetical protein [Pseudomonadota bacterium]